METQPLRRRASGNVRDQEPRPTTQSAHLLNVHSTASRVGQNADEHEKHVVQDASRLRKFRETCHQEASSQDSKSQSSTSFWVTTAAVLFSISLFIFFRIQKGFSFKNLDETLNREGAGILLHPEDHIYRQAATVEHWWSVSTGFRAPDGVKKRVYLINGKRSCFKSFPHPPCNRVF
jgi:hypothetical protein